MQILKNDSQDNKTMDLNVDVFSGMVGVNIMYFNQPSTSRPISQTPDVYKHENQIL